MDAPSESFETDMRRIEAIAARMQNEIIPFEEEYALLVEADKLAERLQSRLDEADQVLARIKGHAAKR